MQAKYPFAELLDKKRLEIPCPAAERGRVTVAAYRYAVYHNISVSVRRTETGIRIEKKERTK